MKIGFVGVGNIGHHLAASLLRAGFEVTVFDLDKSAIDRLVALVQELQIHRAKLHH